MWRKLPWLLMFGVALAILIMAGVARWLLQQERADLGNEGPSQSLLDKRQENTCGIPSAESVAAQETVMVSESGFDPTEVAIKIGQTVRWENNGSSVRRVVVDPHPLHNQCIGLDSKDLQPGESFGFTFTKPGKWQIHLERYLSMQATIIVTE